MARRNDTEVLTDQLLRIREFHAWVLTNVLFPIVPDTIVHPLREQLRLAEHTLVAALYDNNALERVAQVSKVMDRTP